MSPRSGGSRIAQAWWQLVVVFVLGGALIGSVAFAQAGPTKPASESPSTAMVAGVRFRECSHCPEMVVIPPGRFIAQVRKPLEGRPDFAQDPNVPPTARETEVSAAFAMAAYDVTRAEYAEFVRETDRPTRKGCYVWQGDEWINDKTKSWRHPGFAQTDRDPVVCVSWEDAEAYVRWLNGKARGAPSANDGPYRLPTWQEAQYAAAAGATTQYNWGDQPSRERANYGADQCNPCRPLKEGADRWLYTSPVGSFPANRLGLYDMAGNAWQWTSSCWTDVLAPSEPGPGTNLCRWGVLFGGSWLDDGVYLRLAEYGANDRENRNNSMGFRVARDLSMPLDSKDSAAEAAARGPGQGTTFRDCPDCPLMRILPPGRFDLAADTVGAAQTDAPAKAPASVRIQKPFALGVYDVTRAEFASFVKATGWQAEGGCQYLDGFLWRFDSRYSWYHPGFKQTDRDPVVCVSWQDAQAYIHWLNTKVGVKGADGPYRLPSGAEWLYAARGGVRNPVAYFWGHLPGHDHANYGLDDCLPCGVAREGQDKWNYTSPVGSFEPNDFGLFDMVGDVWQWTDDCDHADPTVSADGSIWLAGDCRVRLLFGGSFDDDPFTEQIDKIAANRNNYVIQIRNYANGFRVARSLP